MESSNQFLGTERIGKLMQKYAIPCIISLLVGALYNIVDQIFIANASYLGSYGNAANTVVFPLTVVALAIAVMIGDGCCAFVSISLGQNEVPKAKRSVGNAVVMCLVSSIVLAALYLIFADTILAMFGGTVNTETYHHSQEYFFYITLGVPFYMFGQAMNPIIRADGNPRFAMVSTLAGAALNIILDPILIFGLGMGVKGAAIATLISQLFNLVFIVIGFVLCIKKDGDKPVLSLHFKKITIRDYLIMIMPILISKFLWSLGQNVESAVYGHLGTSNLAAYTLTSPIQGLIVGALSGLSAAAGVIVGKRLGRKEYDEAYTESKKIMYAGLLGGVAVSALLILLAGAYTGLYRVDDSVKELGKTLLIVFALYAPVKVENMILGGGIIRSGGNTKTIMIIDIIGTWCIGIPLCLLAAYVFKWGIVGVYTLLTTEELFRLAVSLIIFKRRNWIVSLC